MNATKGAILSIKTGIMPASPSGNKQQKRNFMFILHQKTNPTGRRHPDTDRRKRRSDRRKKTYEGVRAPFSIKNDRRRRRERRKKSAERQPPIIVV